METQPIQLSRVACGAAIGAAFTFLFLTKTGQRLLDSAEPWLDDLIRDLRRVRAATAKAQEAVAEGRQSLSAIAGLRAGRPAGADSAEPWMQIEH